MKMSGLAKKISAACLFGGLSLQLCCSAPSYGQSEPGGDSPRRAADFTNDLGIGVHMGAKSGPYGDVGAVVGDISYLGFKHVRDSLGGAFSGATVNGQSSPSPDAKLAMFANAGIGWDIIVGPADLPANTGKLHQYARYIESIEGPNEPEFNKYNYNGMSGFPAAVQVQKDLYSAAKNDPALGNVRVLNFAMGRVSNSAKVEPLSAYADFANVHTYPTNGTPPHQYIAKDLAGTVDAPGRSLVVTEVDYPTNDPSGPPGAASGKAGGNNLVDEDVQARYLLDTLLDTFQMKVRRTFVYELFDEAPNPQNNDWQQHFGIYRADKSPKPAAIAVHNLTTILADHSPGAHSFAPTPLAFSMRVGSGQGAPPITVYSLVLEKQNGAHDIILWTEPALWGSNLMRQAAPPPVDVNLSFPTPRDSTTVFDPLLGSTPRATYHVVANLDVQVSDHPLVIEVAGHHRDQEDWRHQ